MKKEENKGGGGREERKKEKKKWKKKKRKKKGFEVDDPPPRHAQISSVFIQVASIKSSASTGSNFFYPMIFQITPDTAELP